MMSILRRFTGLLVCASLLLLGACANPQIVKLELGGGILQKVWNSEMGVPVSKYEPYIGGIMYVITSGTFRQSVNKNGNFCSGSYAYGCYDHILCKRVYKVIKVNNITDKVYRTLCRRPDGSMVLH